MIADAWHSSPTGKEMVESGLTYLMMNKQITELAITNITIVKRILLGLFP